VVVQQPLTWVGHDALKTLTDERVSLREDDASARVQALVLFLSCFHVLYASAPEILRPQAGSRIGEAPNDICLMRHGTTGRRDRSRERLPPGFTVTDLSSWFALPDADIDVADAVPGDSRQPNIYHAAIECG
jgi:hypothetical protein